MTKLNVKGHSNLLDISAENMDLSGGLNVKGQSIFVDISSTNMIINGDLNVVGNVVGNVVDLNSAQTINGSKRFESPIIGNINGSAKLLTNVVNIPSIQTISGIKTFTNTITCNNISSPLFRIVTIINDGKNYFPATTSPLSTILWNGNVYGGTLVFHIRVSGFTATTGMYHYKVKYISGTITKETLVYFYFNNTMSMEMWSVTDVVTGIPSSTLQVQLHRSSTNLRSDGNSYFNITFQELPFV